MRPGWATRPRTTHLVDPGQVPQTAAALLETARSTHLVALGGGRVIDTAKAVASISGAAVAAIPTTLSGAEMTGIHRLPAGAEDRAAGLVRPAPGDRRPGGDDDRRRAAAAGERDERPRAWRRLALHPVRQPGLGVGGAARRGADRLLARRRARRRATAPPSPRARSSAATRSTPACSRSTTSSARRWSGSAAAPTPRPTPRSCRGRWPSWSPGRRTRSTRWRGRSNPRPPRSRPGSFSSAATRPASARRAPTATASTRPSTQMLQRPELGFNPQPPTKAELAELIERAW